MSIRSRKEMREAMARLSDDQLTRARQGAEAERRNHPDRRARAIFSRGIARFDAEIARRNAAAGGR
jgi:hypothetical protein